MSSIAINKIRRDGGTQFRKAIHEDVVSDYAEALKRGDKLPDPVLFYDGTDYWLADGFHTTLAYERNGSTESPADIRPGTRRDARIYAATKANRDHGLRFTNEEKRDRVQALLDDAECANWTNSVIASEVGVSDELVRKMRPASVANIGNTPAKRKGKDGREYKASKPKKEPSTPKPKVETPPPYTPQIGEVRGKKEPVRTVRDRNEEPADDVPTYEPLDKDSGAGAVLAGKPITTGPTPNHIAAADDLARKIGELCGQYIDEYPDLLPRLNEALMCQMSLINAAIKQRSVP